MANTCCPFGYVYVNSDGTFTDAQVGSGIISNSSVIGTGICVVLTNVNFSVSPITAQGAVPNPSITPIECPCCPEGYAYTAFLPAPNICFQRNKGSVANIPCIKCDCIIPPLPVCETCNNSSIPIAFIFPTNTRVCSNCNKLSDVQLSNDPRLNAFLPYTLIDPITNFILY